MNKLYSPGIGIVNLVVWWLSMSLLYDLVSWCWVSSTNSKSILLSMTASKPPRSSFCWTSFSSINTSLHHTKGQTWVHQNKELKQSSRILDQNKVHDKFSLRFVSYFLFPKSISSQWFCFFIYTRFGALFHMTTSPLTPRNIRKPTWRGHRWSMGNGHPIKWTSWRTQSSGRSDAHTLTSQSKKNSNKSPQVSVIRTKTTARQSDAGFPVTLAITSQVSRKSWQAFTPLLARNSSMRRKPML